MNENNTNLIRFSSFDNIHKENSSIGKYCYACLLFGRICSLFLLNVLTKYISLKDIKHAIERLNLNSYVNNSTTSLDELSDAIEFYQFAKSTLGDANFDLRKYQIISNLRNMFNQKMTTIWNWLNQMIIAKFLVYNGS